MKQDQAHGLASLLEGGNAQAFKPFLNRVTQHRFVKTFAAVADRG